ncbi:MAG TPA: hypoxanthine phosphoribosyltransferase, partial [Clostridiales bacterium]|nr:hypoxanthine phosphoribosyltransferase [Clostridiales bacterium]
MIKELEKYIDRELISADEISRRVKELGAEITKDYEGKSVIMVCILRGASVFFADLVREIDVDLSMDFMVISSYGSGTTSSGEVKLIKDLSEGIKGKNVIVVEDIVDTGITMAHMLDTLRKQNPSSIDVCTLL